MRPLGAVHTRFVVGESRTNADNAITKTYGTFYMAFEVDDETLEVVDFSCTHTIDTTQSFLRKVFLGERFPDIDDWLEQTLSERYGGSSRKAVLVASRDALKREKLHRNLLHVCLPSVPPTASQLKPSMLRRFFVPDCWDFLFLGGANPPA